MGKFFRKRNKAFTLVETLVAISIFTVSLLGIMSVLASSIANINYAKRKMVATYLAQEGIEYVRNMRDTYVLYPGNSWDKFKIKLIPCNKNSECGINDLLPATDTRFTFKCSASSKCNLYINDNGSYSTQSGTDSGFVRKIWMIPITDANDGVNEVKIFSKVEWTQGSGLYSITFSENLFNWVE